LLTLKASSLSTTRAVRPELGMELVPGEDPNHGPQDLGRDVLAVFGINVVKQGSHRRRVGVLRFDQPQCEILNVESRSMRRRFGSPGS